MQTRKIFFICFLLCLINTIFSQENKKAKFVGRLKNNSDTLSIIVKEITADSAIVYKYQIIKRNNDYFIQYFSQITDGFAQKSNEPSSRTMNKYKFKAANKEYKCPPYAIANLSEAEILIRCKDKVKKECKPYRKFLLQSGKSTYESKIHTCGDVIIDKIGSLFIVVLNKD